MNKEEFLEKEGGILANISRLNEELANLRKEYIDSNSPFPVGTKIFIKMKYPTWGKRERYAYIVGYELWRGEITPKLMRAKKDGSISKVRDHISFQKVEITKAEE